ncbi:MAG: hypothetical protein H6669_05445 [Ardenticatenaceae bacterium]|nr:hypothetical protein [Ardenticatenaceae bacterium]
METARQRLTHRRCRLYIPRHRHQPPTTTRLCCPYVLNTPIPTDTPILTDTPTPITQQGNTSLNAFVPITTPMA